MRLAFQIALILFSLCVLQSADAQSFIKNKGQWHDDALYKLELKNNTIYVKQNGLRFHLQDPLALQHLHPETGKHSTFPDSILNHVFDVEFNSAAAEVIPLKKDIAYRNYYLGKDKSKWQANVSMYQEVRYKELYPGIDLLLKSGPANLKYDLILAPRANPDNIRWNYNHIDSIYLDQNRLIINTAVGRLVEEAPIAWQIIKGKVVPVEVAFVLNGNIVQIQLGDYKKNKELIIDPNFVFSTYTGSTADNFGFTATYDNNGNSYGGGIVFGNGYPLTTGAFQSNFGGAPIDISISKFSADGTQLIYSTYLGGNDADQPHSMVVDSLGNLILIGITSSLNYPVTPTAFDTTFNGGPTNTIIGQMFYANGVDMVITKFNASGDSLLASTFLGGSNTDGANKGIPFNYGDVARSEVIVADDGDIFFISSSRSTDFPVTVSNAFQDTMAGDQDAIFGALSSDLASLKWSTYMGGSGNDAGYSLKLNTAQSKVFVAGGTKSQNFPIDPNSYQPTFGGINDGWIASFNRSDGAYITSTFNGTTHYDQNFFVALDAEDAVYVFGQTKGLYPTTPGVWQVPNSAQFIHKFSENLKTSLKSTVFGNGSINNINISPTALMVDACKSIYISGWGGATNTEGTTTGMPTTQNAYDTITDGSDFYFLVLDGSWKFIEYATFFGGNNAAEHVDGGTSRFSPEGIIHQAVCAGCGGKSSFPAFPSNVWSTTNNSQNCNLACFKVEFQLQKARVNVVFEPDSSCAPHLLKFKDYSTNVDVMLWDFDDGTFFTGRNPVKVFNTAGFYNVKIIGIDTLCNTSDTALVPLYIFSSNTKSSFIANYDSCDVSYKVSFTNTSPPVTSFIWNFGDGTTSMQLNPVKIYNKPGPHLVYLAIQDSLCGSWDTAYTTIEFKVGGGDLTFSSEYEPCINWQEVVFTPRGSGTYHSFNWAFGDGSGSNQRFPTHQYVKPGTYLITMNAFDTICGHSIKVTEEINIIYYEDFDEIFPNVFTPNEDGLNDTWQIVKNIQPEQFSEFNLEVFNRWGGSVLKTQNAAFSWNGNFENKKLADGVYFWLVSYKDVCGNYNEVHGEVHLMR